MSDRASSRVAAANAAALDRLPFADTDDFEDARRGFVGTIDPMRIETPTGGSSGTCDAYSFLDGDAPRDA